LLFPRIPNWLQTANTAEQVRSSADHPKLQTDGRLVADSNKKTLCCFQHHRNLSSVNWFLREIGGIAVEEGQSKLLHDRIFYLAATKLAQINPHASTHKAELRERLRQCLAPYGTRQNIELAILSALAIPSFLVNSILSPPFLADPLSKAHGSRQCSRDQYKLV
jgi:hypothetical protein